MHLSGRDHPSIACQARMRPAIGRTVALSGNTVASASASSPRCFASRPFAMARRSRVGCRSRLSSSLPEPDQASPPPPDRRPPHRRARRRRRRCRGPFPRAVDPSRPAELSHHQDRGLAPGRPQPDPPAPPALHRDPSAQRVSRAPARTSCPTRRAPPPRSSAHPPRPASRLPRCKSGNRIAVVGRLPCPQLGPHREAALAQALGDRWTGHSVGLVQRGDLRVEVRARA